MSNTGEFKKIAPGLAWIPSWVRENATFAGAWAFGCGLVVAGISLGHVEDRLQRSEERIVVLEHQNEDLRHIQADLREINTKLDWVQTDMREQKDWRSRVETVAEIRVPRRR